MFRRNFLLGLIPTSLIPQMFRRKKNRRVFHKQFRLQGRKRFNLNGHTLFKIVIHGEVRVLTISKKNNQRDDTISILFQPAELSFKVNANQLIFDGSGKMIIDMYFE